ncbi:MAG: DUF1501 domain-containing protein [Verrucomicrobiales bacterium]|nr:DUF1501 domain-containing protein [Verrucomicrobiales bacterium]
MKRRHFLKQSGLIGAAAATGSVDFLSANEAAGAGIPFGKVEHVIQIWLGGGAAQIDTWDPKKMGDAKERKPGSYYPAIDTNMPGVKVCEHLKQCAGMMDKITAVRTVHHDVIDEHAAATNRMHTGRNVSGTIVYPSIGSCVAHEKGPAAEGVPSYVVIGYPNVARGPGFLGAQAGFLYLLDTAAGPAGLKRPDHIDDSRQSRRERLLAEMRKSAIKNRPGTAVENYDATVEESLRLSGPEFMSVFDLESEKGDLRTKYGDEFGQRCLLARRLIQRGVRFIEVSHNMNFRNGTGWDTHNEGQLNQHLLISELDQAMSTLITDLENHKLLDKTLIVVNTEFGRPAGFDGRGGRGHQGTAFTVVLAGGGLKHCGAYGLTDELSKTVVEKPVGVPDLFATIHASMGINPAKELYDGDRPVPITDRGKPILDLLG